MRITSALVVLACAIAPRVASAQQPAPPAISPAAFAGIVSHVAEGVNALSEAHPDEMTAVIRSLPPVWRVILRDGPHDVSTDWMRHDMTLWQQHPAVLARNNLIEHLRFVGAEAASAETGVAAPPATRAAMEAILSQPEFRDAGGPSLRDRLSQRLVEWLIRMLGASMQSTTMSIVTRVLVYVLMAAAVALVALVMYRAMRFGSTPESLRLDAGGRPLAPVAYEDAKRAAAQGEWRDAIALAYWWGIQTLESRGVWRPDRARTPREYVRQLPAGSTQAPPLGALTQLFERVSYAGDAADASTFDEAIAHLTRLGCLGH